MLGAGRAERASYCGILPVSPEHSQQAADSVEGKSPVVP